MKKPLAVLLCLLTLPIAAQALTFAFNPIADSYIRRGNNADGDADRNFGNSTQIVIKRNGANTTTRKGYLQFDISGLSVDPALIKDVSLGLNVTTNNSGGGSTVPVAFTFDVFGIDDLVAGEMWIEGNGGTGNSPAGEIDWINAPANDRSGNGVDAALTTELASGAVAAINPALGTPPNGPQPISVADTRLTDFLTQDTNGIASFILERTSGSGSNNLGFASKEFGDGSFAPVLLITIPEPSRVLLLGMAGIALVLRRRR